MTIQKWTAIQSIINVVLLFGILFISFQFYTYKRDMSELNRLQNVFNGKTIEFFKLINENEAQKNQ